MLNSDKRQQLGRYLVEINNGYGWQALRTIAADIQDGAMENLKISEQGGERNRGKITAMDELFETVDECIKEFSQGDGKDESLRKE